MIYNEFFLRLKEILWCPGEDPVRGELRMRFGGQLLGDQGLTPFVQPPCSSKRNEAGTGCCEGFAGRAILGSLLLGLGHSWCSLPAWPGRTRRFLWWRCSCQAQMLSLQTTFERRIQTPNKTRWLLNPLSNSSFPTVAWH